MTYTLKSIFTHLFGSKQTDLSTPFSKEIIRNIKMRNTPFTIKYDVTDAGQLEQEIEQAMASLQTTSPYCYHNFSQYRYVYTEYDTHISVDFHMTFKTNDAEEAYVQTQLQHIITQLSPAKKSDLELVQAVHDYIILNYSYNIQTKRSPYSVHTLLLEKQGVCQSMALLACALFDKLSIPCLYVTGHGNGEDHGWNLVQVGGHWYHLDITWDNPNFGKNIFENYRVNYQYFLLSDKQILKDHQMDSRKYPAASSEAYKNLHEIVDSVRIGHTVYFPHKTQNEKLYKMDIHDPSFKLVPVLDTRVQFLSSYNTTLYFSNYSDSGHLYSYTITEQKLKQLTRFEIKNTLIKDGNLYVENINGSVNCIELKK